MTGWKRVEGGARKGCGKPVVTHFDQHARSCPGHEVFERQGDDPAQQQREQHEQAGVLDMRPPWEPTTCCRPCLRDPTDAIGAERGDGQDSGIGDFADGPEKVIPCRGHAAVDIADHSSVHATYQNTQHGEKLESDGERPWARCTHTQRLACCGPATSPTPGSLPCMEAAAGRGRSAE